MSETKSSGGGGGIGCAGFILSWVMLLALYGYGVNGLEPQEAVAWAFGILLGALPYACPGLIVVALFGMLLFSMAKDWA